METEPLKDGEMYRLADQFISHLRVEKGLSENTIASYSNDLIRFLQFLEGRDRSPLHATQEDLVDYMAGLRGRLSPRSMARNLSALKGFFRFLLAEDKIEANPARLLNAPKLCNVSLATLF